MRCAGRILLEPDHPGLAHLGRLAVRRMTRGTGLGARLMYVLESVALEHAGAPLGARAAE
ncbi:GNAT family N-acetyltransferase [Actinomyces trachealis]|uniref:GNAT family N-acetyltransferase n=1 Tax=Actinomyces trachealis TaxID=2763540 RepID=UPI002E2E6C33|nr:GNAT family N-acetyltransferase [Actinomyces trachealis]